MATIAGVHCLQRRQRCSGGVTFLLLRFSLSRFPNGPSVAVVVSASSSSSSSRGANAVRVVTRTSRASWTIFLLCVDTFVEVVVLFSDASTFQEPSFHGCRRTSRNVSRQTTGGTLLRGQQRYAGSFAASSARTVAAAPPVVGTVPWIHAGWWLLATSPASWLFVWQHPRCFLCWWMARVASRWASFSNQKKKSKLDCISSTKIRSTVVTSYAPIRTSTYSTAIDLVVY